MFAKTSWKTSAGKSKKIENVKYYAMLNGLLQEILLVSYYASRLSIGEPL